MYGGTHLAAGVTAGLAVASASGISDPLELAGCAALGGLGGLIPDWLQINIPGASRQIKGTFGHRGFSHWAWSALGAWWLARDLVPEALAYSLLSGWITHIILDALAGGVPALWPFGRLRWGKIATGGRTDRFIGGAMLVLAVLLGLALFL